MESDKLEITWPLALQVWWSYAWRTFVFSLVISVVLGFIAGFLVALIGKPQAGQSLGIAQMCVGIHKAYFSSEESRALCAFEKFLNSTVVFDGAVHQSYTIDAFQVFLYQFDVVFCLLRRKYAA